MLFRNGFYTGVRVCFLTCLSLIGRIGTLAIHDAYRSELTDAQWSAMAPRFATAAPEESRAKLMTHKQNMTVAAMQMMLMKVCAHRSYRVAMRHQSRLNAIVGDHHRRFWRQRLQDSPSAAIIADLALGEQQDQWLAVHIATCVQLGGLAAFGPPDAEKNSLILRKLAAVRCGAFG
jgi:hypothetical protein